MKLIGNNYVVRYAIHRHPDTKKHVCRRMGDITINRAQLVFNNKIHNFRLDSTVCVNVVGVGRLGNLKLCRWDHDDIKIM